MQWSRSETLQAQIDGREQEKRACSEKRAAAQQKIDRLAAEVQQKEAQRQEYIRKKDSSNACRELEELDRAGRRLLDEQEKLTRRLENEALEIKREALRLEHLGETVLSWDEEGSLDAVCEAAQQVRGAYEPLRSGKMSIFAQPQSIFEAAQEATDALMNAMQEASHRLGDRLTEAREQLGKRKKVLAGLRDNVKDYPRGLLACRSRLESELAQQVGAPVAVNILADVLEIADEAWRGAVEGYLGSQKLYFLVEPRRIIRRRCTFTTASGATRNSAPSALSTLAACAKRKSSVPWTAVLPERSRPKTRSRASMWTICSGA